jgi:HlyD family secretion protein
MTAKERTNKTSPVRESLGMDPTRKRRNRLWIWLIVVFLATAAVMAGFLLTDARGTRSIPYKTEQVRRGDLLMTVTATGNLEPTNQVDVGSELSGIVRYVDMDTNDRVKVGQILARMDTTKLKAQVMQSEASLASAKAKVLQARATVREASSNLARLKKVRELSGNKAPSQYEMDAAEAALHRAEADQAGAMASVSLAQATLDVNRTDLEKAVIRSPINGIVLARSVEPGQTVAASLQAPVLFTLAEDLTRMELHVDVDEADVGQVRKGQEATFTVDAYPNRLYAARITRVHYGSRTTDGVVTYETVLKVDNTDISLRPGMTATADITVRKLENALLVPNAALRFTPPSTDQTPSRRGIFRALLPGPPARDTRKNKRTGDDKKRQRVWVLRDGLPAPLSVATGVTDGAMTQILDGDIAPGTALVVDVAGTPR